MAQKSSKILSFGIALATLSIATSHVQAQQQTSSGSSIPGAGTAAAILASSLDGMSRYFAPDGPIQPAITAIGGLPMRGGEYLNRGITSISSGLNSGAQRMSRAAGQNGQIAMPGMQTLRENMPSPLTSLGGMMRSAIQGKNGFIRGQAESGVEAGNRLKNMMERGLQSRKKRDTLSSTAGDLISAPTMMHESGNAGMQMMNQMQDTMMKGGQQIKSQLQEHVNGAMGRLQGVQGMGDNLRNQAQGITRTLSDGFQRTMGQLQRTGQQVQQQIQGGLKQNMGSMSNMMNSMQGSVGKMGQHMQNNGQGLMRVAHNAVQQVHQHIQQAAQGPLSMVQNLSGSLTNMMQGKMNVMSSGGHGGGQKGGNGY